MDPDKQDAPNSIENSIYRTAFKLRSVQTLCQLDLVDSSLIQHVLLRQSLRATGDHALPAWQLLQALRELFQRVMEEQPGQVHPGAPELTLSLLTAIYDSTGTGFLRLVPAAAALLALSGDSPLTKYRALFQLYAGGSWGGHNFGARMTRRALRSLLTDLQQIPMVVGECHSLCSVDSAMRSCFLGVLSPAIKEEKFLSWVQSEPLILLWLPTCHRLSAAATVTHPARCRVCRTFPITGLRYRCLKCLNFDICQVCFLSGLHSKSHQKSHPVVEHCVQMSAKENAKLVFRTLRNNLLQGHCRRKEATRRQRLLDQVTLKSMANPAPARLLKKQLNRYKDRLQAMCTFQGERSCQLETKIHELTVNQDGLWTKMRQMGQDLQAMLQPLPPLSSCQNVVSKADHSSVGRFWEEADSSQIMKTIEDSSEWESLPHPAEVDRIHRHQANTEHVLPNSESPGTILHSTGDQSQAQKALEEILSSLHSHGLQERLQQVNPQGAPVDMSLPPLAPAQAERKETGDFKDRETAPEEEELQELLCKLVDAVNLEMLSGPQSPVNMDLHGGAEWVCRAFSALIDHLTHPA
ncbi:dystrotelin [Carlito syrichta]|uniref:Dystrotelin n=1 Tax=Carlito syrichta TaxID=1868482 RepID=A0A1U7TD58_CARSF|nr:dystrotelin [Carlito syrichta]